MVYIIMLWWFPQQYMKCIQSTVGDFLYKYQQLHV